MLPGPALTQRMHTAIASRPQVHVVHRLTAAWLSVTHHAIQVSLLWQLSAPLEKDLTLYIHLVTSNNTASNSIRAQLSEHPRDTLGHPMRTSSWKAHTLQLTSAHLHVPEGLEPGAFSVVCGVYHLSAATPTPDPFPCVDNDPKAAPIRCLRPPWSRRRIRVLLAALTVDQDGLRLA